jgi:hypothetical protein
MQTESEEPRVETLTASLLYLMSHYKRTGCPRLAVCVSRHMQCLAAHPDAAPVLRDICAGLHGAWAAAAAPPDRERVSLH